MYRRRLTMILLSVVTLLFLTPARPLHAAPNLGDEVILGDDLALSEGEHVDGDVVIIGGNLTMQVGSHVEGSITALGGRVKIDGAVDGDLVALGGNIDLGAQARVTGDVLALGGRVRQAAGAEAGQIIEGMPLRNIRLWRDLRVPLFSPGNGFRSASTIWTTVSTVASAVVLALLGMAIVTFWPTQTTQVGETLLTRPLPSLGVGCLLFPLAASFSVFILVTVCLAPFAPVVVLMVVAASLLGWVALGRLLGRWLARRTGWRGATPLAVTGVGVFALTIVAAVLGALPCLGPILVLGAASIGVGAVALSRFGTSPPGSRAVDSAAEA